MNKSQTFLLFACIITALLFAFIGFQPSFIIDTYWGEIESGFIILWVYLLLLPVIAGLLNSYLKN